MRSSRESWRSACVRARRGRPVRQAINQWGATGIKWLFYPQASCASRREKNSLRSGVLSRIWSAGENDFAWDACQRCGLAELSGCNPSATICEGGFERAAAGFTPFAWTMVGEDDLRNVREAAPGSDGEGHLLKLVAQSGRSGQAAVQLLRLEPGSYHRRARTGDVPADRFERHEERITCATVDATGPLFVARPEEVGPEARRIGGKFFVCPECTYKWLALDIAEDGPPLHAVPWIAQMTIARAAS